MESSADWALPPRSQRCLVCVRVCISVCVCETSLRMYIEGRAGPGGAVRGGAEQGRAEQVRARQGRAGQGRAGQNQNQNCYW